MLGEESSQGGTVTMQSIHVDPATGRAYAVDQTGLSSPDG
jgi:hypothetical protein